MDSNVRCIPKSRGLALLSFIVTDQRFAQSMLNLAVVINQPSSSCEHSNVPCFPSEIVFQKTNLPSQFLEHSLPGKVARDGKCQTKGLKEHQFLKGLFHSHRYPTSCLLLDFHYLLHLGPVSWTNGRPSASSGGSIHYEGRKLTGVETLGQVVAVGESRNNEGQVHQQRKVDNRKTGCVFILDFLWLTHFSLTAEDISSHSLSTSTLIWSAETIYNAQLSR